MRIQNLNPDTAIGASAWLVEVDGHRLLLDAGTHPKREGRAGLPLYSKMLPGDLDAIALSHCHHDHVGSLPVAMRQFPKAHVFLTELSYFLIERVLHNSVNVMLRQREELGIHEYPLYSHTEVDDLAPRFQGCRYCREIEWAAWHRPRPGAHSPTLVFYDAGHVLGSAGVWVRGQRETLFYTGDVSFRDQTLQKAARFEEVTADVLIMETTRGARATPVGFSRQAEVERFTAALDRVLARKGCVLIPTFALGRTQEILAILAGRMKAGHLRRQPIYVGGLGYVFTEIYDLEGHRAHHRHPNLRLTEALNLVVLDSAQIESPKLTGGRIFVVTAGMMTEHTAAHDLALHLMRDARHAIFFVGYADPDTPGGRLKASRPGEKFLFSASAGEVVRQCEVREFDLTAHALREDLLEFAVSVGPRVVILGHGDDQAQAWFAEQLRQRLPRARIVRPEPGQRVEV